MALRFKIDCSLRQLTHLKFFRFLPYSIMDFGKLHVYFTSLASYTYFMPYLALSSWEGCVLFILIFFEGFLLYMLLKKGVTVNSILETLECE